MAAYEHAQGVGLLRTAARLAANAHYSIFSMIDKNFFITGKLLAFLYNETDQSAAALIDNLLHGLLQLHLNLIIHLLNLAANAILHQFSH